MLIRRKALWIFLTVEEIIENAEELSILEYKITALQVALEN